MKKVLILLLCVITLSIGVTYARETFSPLSNDNPACVNVGNVSANIQGDFVCLYNSNSYKVTVTWSVYGHRENGSKSEVGSGVVVLGTDSESRACNVRFSKSSQYTSYSVKISAQKCD